MTPQTVNASCSPSFNAITFPAAILRPPFFDFNADDVVNYGGKIGRSTHGRGKTCFRKNPLKCAVK